MSEQTLRCVLVRVLVAAAVTVGGESAMNAMLPQAGDGTFTSAERFMPRDGAVLYRSSCQACHMPDGQGASGAGAYPALARNTKLRTARYATTIVVRGQKGMPGFGGQLDDEQVAAVVNYVRTHFGNDYRDMVSAADAGAVRQ